MQFAKATTTGALAAALLLAAGTADGQVQTRNNGSAARLVRDGMGREVRVPLRPQRIVSLSPSVTETLFAIGAGDLLVGRTDYCNYPPEALRKPSVGGIVNPSLERIVSLQPDLVIASADANRIDTERALRRLRITAYALFANTLEEVLDSIRQAGDLTGRNEQAAVVIEMLQQRMRRIERAVEGKRRPRVLFVLWQQPLISVGRSSFAGDLLERAGAASITDAIPEPWPRLSLEEVVRADPEFLIAPQGQGMQVTPGQFARPGWRQTTAARKGQIVIVEEDALRPSPRVFDALETIFRALYPEEANRLFRKTSTPGERAATEPAP